MNLVILIRHNQLWHVMKNQLLYHMEHGVITWEQIYKIIAKKNFNIITFACEWSFKILVSSIQCLSYGQLKVKDWLGVTGGQLNDIIFTVNVYTLALLVNNGQARDIVLDKFMHHIYHLGTNVCYLDMQ